MGIAGSRSGDETKGIALFWLVLLLALLALLAVGLPRPAAAAEGAATATAARVGGDDIRTRFVADLDRAVSFNVYVLPDPYRVLIDLPDVRFDLPPGAGDQTRGLISAYRYGPVAPGRSRIVLDTTGPVLIEKSFVVDAKTGQPARIVVDLVKTSEETFRKSFKLDEQQSQQAVAEADQSPEAGATAEEDPIASLMSEQPPPAEEGAEPGAESQAAAEPTPGPAKLPGKKVVVIDPGHGGIDPGAIGVSRTREKDVVLAVARKLRDELQHQGTYEVIMTRDDDKFLNLRDRVKVARAHAADLFIAIHADTVRGPEARGATIYTLSEKASDAEAEELAQKENRADIINGIDLGGESEEVADILIDLAQRESKHHSLVFAKKAVSEMKKVTAFTGKPLRSAGFMVLKAPDVPSVLVELGYLSTKTDESQLVSAKWQQKVAESLAGAIDKYFATEVASTAN